VVIAYLARAVRLSVIGEARVGAGSLAERRQRSDQLWYAAQQLASAGQIDEAVRLVYLSALYALDERALLRVETALTNREHAQRLRSLHPSLGATFAEVVDGYDRIRYGHALAVQGKNSFGELSRRVERVRAGALRGGSP